MKKLLASVFLTSIVLLTAGAPARSWAATDPATATTSSTPGGVVEDTRAGGYAAFGCGLFTRALGSGMVNVGTIAGAVASCAYMFIDALFFDR